MQLSLRTYPKMANCRGKLCAANQVSSGHESLNHELICYFWVAAVKQRALLLTLFCDF